MGLGLTFFVSPSTHFTAGLYHSHSLDCGTTLLRTLLTIAEYGDTLDIMGIPHAGHFNARTPPWTAQYPETRPRVLTSCRSRRNFREGGL